MTARTLAEVDEIYGSAPAWVVEAWEAEDTGVDPLGLRQTNLDMMDRVLPGINNVTRHVRVYTVMTWAWWKAGKLLSDEGEHGASSAAMRDFVDRADAVFSWSQFLLEPDATLPGRTVLPKELDTSLGSPVAYDFSSDQWPKLRTSRRNSTDLLGAVQYGPSVRGAQGLHWLLASDGVFVPSQEALPAIEAFDALVAPHLPKCLRNPHWNTITLQELNSVGPIWRYRESTPTESQTFAELFFGNTSRAQKDALLARRRETIDLMLSTMRDVGKPCSVRSLRAAMFRLSDVDDSSLSGSRHAWRVLQLRQLQRLAIEAMYTAVETYLKASAQMSSNEIVSALLDSLAGAGLSETMSTQSMLNAAFDTGWNNTGSTLRWSADPSSAIFDLIDALIAAQRTDLEAVPRVALAALRCTEALAEVERSTEPGAAALRDFEREPDRLPIGLMLERLTALRSLPVKELLREIVEAWVFGQHIRWSIARSGDGKQRLRIALDEGGWTFLRGQLSGVFEPTPDRLLSALRLSAGCGLVQPIGEELWAPL